MVFSESMAAPAKLLANLLATLVALCSCVWLASGDQIAKPSRSDHDYRVVVVTEPSRLNASALGAQVWIRDLQLDGQAAVGSRITAAGNWRHESADSSWLYVCESGEADLSWRSKTFSLTVLRHPWSGRLDVLEDGVRIDSISLTAAGDTQVTVRYGEHIDWAGIGLVTLAAAGVMASLRPWRGGGRLTLLLSLLVVVVHLECWLTTPICVTSDTPGYLLAVDALMAGHPDYFPPGYGLLLRLVGVLGGHTGLVTTLLQHALMLLVAVVMHIRFRAFVPEAWSFLGAFVGGVAYPTLYGAQAVMSETWTCVLIVGTVFFAVRVSERSRPLFACLAGLSAGLAALTRVVPLAGSLPLFAALGLLPWSKRCWGWFAVAAALALLPVVAVVASNGVRSDRWNVSSGGGRHLYNHFVYQQRLLDSSGPATVEFMKHLGGRDPRDLTHWEAAALLPASTGADYIAADDLFNRVSMEAARTAGIWEHIRFVSGLTWRNLSISAVGSMTIGVQGLGTNSPMVHPPLIAGDSTNDVMLRRSAEWNDSLWTRCAWLFAASLGVPLLLRRGRMEWLSWIWIVWAYMVASSAVEFELPRYHVAVAPIVVMLAFGTLGVVGQRCAALLPAFRVMEKPPATSSDGRS